MLAVKLPGERHIKRVAADGRHLLRLEKFVWVDVAGRHQQHHPEAYLPAPQPPQQPALPPERLQDQQRPY